jgi:hypothetical protein
MKNGDLFPPTTIEIKEIALYLFKSPISMNKVILIFFFIIFSKFSFAQDVPKLRIDPAQAYGGTVSEYFDSVEYIPLETTKESLFGDVFQLLVTDSSIVVYDLDTKYVLFFTLSGKYITKIKENWPPIISYDKVKQRLKVISTDLGTNGQKAKKLNSAYYSCTGRKINEKPPISSMKIDENATLFPMQSDFYLSARGCDFPKGELPKDSVIHLINIYHGDSLYKSKFPVNQKDDPCFCSVLGGWADITPIPNDPNAFYASLPSEYAIYKVTTDTTIKLYQLVLPANRSVPKNLLASKNQVYLDSFRHGRGIAQTVIRGIKNVYISNQLLMFKLDPFGVPLFQNSSESDYQYNFIYNIRSGRLVSLERITSDAKNYFLPLAGSFQFALFGLQYINNNFYTCVSSLKMFTEKDKNKSRNPQYPPVLQEYFKTQNRKSNPVIVKMKLKE